MSRTPSLFPFPLLLLFPLLAAAQSPRLRDQVEAERQRLESAWRWK